MQSAFYRRESHKILLFLIQYSICPILTKICDTPIRHFIRLCTQKVSLTLFILSFFISYRLMPDSIPSHPIPATSEASFFDFIEWSRKENEYDVSFPHRHQYYELILIDEGTGMHEIDFVPIEAAAPALHFLPIGKVHRLTMNPPYSGYSCLFSAAFFPQANSFLSQFSFFHHQNAYPILALDENSYPPIKQWIEEIQLAWNTPTSDKWEWIRTHLSLILLQAHRLYIKEKPQIHANKNIVIQKFIDLVEIHHLDHWTLQKYAEELFISEPYLNALCKKDLGISASAVIQGRLIQAAKKKLAYTSESVKEIAFQLNFNDPSYFIRFFKKQVGYSPNVYREEVIKNM